MMMKEDIVKQIIKDVGGSENINNAWHCMTRLRFDLKDEKKVDYTALEKTLKWWERNIKAISSKW